MYQFQRFHVCNMHIIILIGNQELLSSLHYKSAQEMEKSRRSSLWHLQTTIASKIHHNENEKSTAPVRLIGCLLEACLPFIPSLLSTLCLFTGLLMF